MKKINLLLTFILAVLATCLTAQTGTLDPTFGTKGVVQTSISGFLSASVLQPDGKIIVAGSSEDNAFTLARFNTDGSLDDTFGSGGVVTSVEGHIFSIALQPDGKIIVAGSVQNSRSTKDFVLARYNPTGVLDPTFGNNGIVISVFAMGFGDYVIRSIVLQPDGKIVVAGSVKYEKSGQFAMARYNEDGTLDQQFGKEGKVFTDFSSGVDWARTVHLQADGKIIVGGSSDGMFVNANFALIRYHSNGTLDSSFGDNGRVSTDFIGTKDLMTCLALQTDGKIVAAGHSWSGTTMDVGVVRYNKDGSLDDRFGAGGKLATAYGQSTDLALDVALHADGKIVVVGHTMTDKNFDFAITRYKPDGSLDERFGKNGQTITDHNATNDMILSVEIQADGKIVVAGVSGVGGIDGFEQGYKSVFTLARYLSK